MAPLLNEPGDDHSAETRRIFLQKMLRRYYGKDITECAFIVGDNCSVNKRLAGLLHVAQVGCANHRLNLAMEELVEESSQDLGSVQALMIKLRSLNQAAKLRLKTSLRPVIRQETRWSSTFIMLDRYFKVLEFVKDDADLEDALPTRAENRRLMALHAELTNVESVTKALQSTKVSMADARLFFDGLITLRASFAKYLGERPDIVYAADFEAACVKVQEGRAHQLSRAQKAAVSQLVVREAPATGAASDGAQDAAKRRKRTGSSGDEEESFVELLKSARLERHNLLPITFEAILLLRLSDG
ncbi:hypothetical protein JG688_00006107 [Phytophthora aleatoria]|uniref:Uncharacterized protein n=1 Tax=Phytophthora aleatoria TaxID=2496075 RepID=A0A8J5ILQ8_9STRA|nr:hypothetical protein JG688_00006107 [Phytophthora aleatoria]